MGVSGRMEGKLPGAKRGAATQQLALGSLSATHTTTITITIMIPGQEEARRGDGDVIAGMVARVSHVYTYPQTHQVVYTKYVQIFTCQEEGQGEGGRSRLAA